MENWFKPLSEFFCKDESGAPMCFTQQGWFSGKGVNFGMKNGSMKPSIISIFVDHIPRHISGTILPRQPLLQMLDGHRSRC